jgi:predicted nucleic acid-binding protein
MTVKVFLDTNIIIDFFDPKRLEHQWAVSVISAIENDELESYLTESVLNTAAYILRKQYSANSLREILSHLLSFTRIISCTNDFYNRSLSLSGNDIEDAVLYQLALEKKIDYFVTSDKKDFNKFFSPLLRVVTAKELMKLIV